MTSPMTDELIATAPVDNPRIIVDGDDRELTIHIEGKQKPRLPAPLITALIVWGFAAFVCPGVLLVSLFAAPIALIAGAILWFTRPRLLKQTLETETVVIGREEILFSRHSTISDDEEESPDIALPLKKFDRLKLQHDSDDVERPPRLLFTDTDGTHHSLGTCLPPPDEDSEEDYRIEELQWLAGVIDAHMETLLEVELDFASLAADESSETTTVEADVEEEAR